MSRIPHLQKVNTGTSAEPHFELHGKVELPAWAGFDGWGHRKEWMASTEALGVFDLRVVCPDDLDDALETTGQSNAYHHLVQNATAQRNRILSHVLQHYQQTREARQAYDTMPFVDAPEGLKNLIGPGTIYLWADERDGGAFVGYQLGCEWSDEGVGVLMSWDEVVDIGAGDVARASDKVQALGEQAQRRKVEKALAELAPLGIMLHERVTVQDLVDDDFYHTLELNQRTGADFNSWFLYYLSGSHMYKDGEHWEFCPLSPQLWYCDGERDGPVEYGDFVLRLNEMTGNQYDFTEVETIDLSEEWIEAEERGEKEEGDDWNGDPGCYGVHFTCKGQTYRWMFYGTDDWLDDAFFTRFFQLVQEYYGVIELNKFFEFGEGQGMVIGYLPPDKQRELCEWIGRKRTFEPVLGRPAPQPEPTPKPEYVIPNYTLYSREELVEALDEIYEAQQLGDDDPSLTRRAALIDEELSQRPDEEDQGFLGSIKRLWKNW